MRKYLFFLLLVPLGLVFAQPQAISVADNQTRISEIINYLSVGENLDSLMVTINSALGAANLLDAVYELNIGTVKLEALVRGGRIVELSGPTSIPDKVMYISFDTTLRIIDSANPAYTAFMALVTGEIILTDSTVCKSDASCADNEVCVNGNCTRAFTIAVVPLFYGPDDYELFYRQAKEEVDLFLETAPISEDLFRVHYVPPSVCPNVTCNQINDDCHDAALNCSKKAGLNGVVDKVVGFSKEDLYGYLWSIPIPLCGSGSLNGTTAVVRARNYTTQTFDEQLPLDVYTHYVTGVVCYGSLAHNLGRALGLREFFPGHCHGVNSVDCGIKGKERDVMNQNGYPRDHFGPAATDYLINGPLSDYQTVYPESLSGSECVNDSDCDVSEACADGFCHDTFVVSIVPLFYNDSSEFLSAAQKEVDFFLEKANITEGLIKFNYVDPGVCGFISCANIMTDCPQAVINCSKTAGLYNVSDRLIGFSKNDTYLRIFDIVLTMVQRTCGYNYAGSPRDPNLVGYVAVTQAPVLKSSRTIDGVYYYPQYQCVGSLAHHMGVLLGLRPYLGDCRWSLDCGPGNKTDIMNEYSYPKDHFGPETQAYFNEYLINYSRGLI